MSGLFSPKAPKANKPTPVNGLEVQTSSYGLPIALRYGRNRAAGQLIDYVGFRAVEHAQKQKSGGKGAPKPATTYSYTYNVTFLLALGEGTYSAVNRVWKDKEVMTLTAAGLTLFTGSPGQAAWSYMTTKYPSRALTYANTAYVAAPDLDLGGSPALPNYNFDISGLLYLAGKEGAAPKDIVVDYLTHPQHGAGFNFLDTLTVFDTYCKARGIYLSPFEDSQRPAANFVKEMAETCNSALVWGQGKLKLVPYGDEQIVGADATYTPDLTPLFALTPDDFAKGSQNDAGAYINIERKPLERAYNHVRLEVRDRNRDYITTVVEAKDQADIDLRGLRSKGVMKMEHITDPLLGRDVAQMVLQRELYVRRTFTFRLTIRHILLDLMDYVSLTDPAAGLELTLARVIAVTEENDGLSVECEEVLASAASAPLYTTQNPEGHLPDFNVAPGSVNAPVLINAPAMLCPTGYELWIAADAASSNWGGSQVWISYDNLEYKFVGSISGRSRIGTLNANVAAYGGGAVTDATSTVDITLGAGEMFSGTDADRDNFRTLSYLQSNGGEFIGYKTAALVSPLRYALTSLARGGYGSTAGAHLAGTKYVRVDETIFRLPYDPADDGKTVYVKLPSYNIYGAAAQTLADATAYSIVLKPNTYAGPARPNDPIFAGIASDITDALTAANNAQATADGAIVSFWQATPPVIGPGASEAKVGDIWFDTDDGNKIYRVVGAAWVTAADDDMAQAILAASTAQATADGKIKTFFQSATPTASGVGDLWYNTATKVIARWNGSAWSTVSDNDGAATKTEIFNPGWEQGLLGWADAIGGGATGWYTEPGGYSGTNMLVKFGGQTGHSGLYNVAGLMPVAPGQRIAVSVVAQAVNAPPGGLSFGLIYYDKDGTYITSDQLWNVQSHTYLDANTAWTKLRKVVTVPALAVGARFGIAVHGFTAGTTYWLFDNAQVEYLANSIDEVPDGTSYARMFGQYLQGGAPFQLSFGDNMVQNSRFEDTAISAPIGNYAAGVAMSPGWEVGQRDGDFSLGMEAIALGDSQRQGFIGNYGGTVLANGATMACSMTTKAAYPVQEGEQFIATSRLQWDIGVGTPAGVLTELQFGAFFFNASGAFVGSSWNVIKHTDGFYSSFPAFKVEPTEQPITVPPGVASMKIGVRSTITNNTGANYTTGYAHIHARFDNVTCRKVHLASAGQPNLLRNTDFNNGVSEWAGVDSITISPTEGNQARKGALADGAFSYMFQDTVLGYDVGTYVTFSAYVIQIGGNAGLGSRFQFGLEFFAGATYIAGLFAPSVVPGTTLPLKFTRFSVTARVPPGSVDKIRCVITQEGPQDLFVMIQPKLEKGPFATAYVTGADGTYSQGLIHPGSRRRIGDQRNLPQSNTTAYGSARTAFALSANSSGQVSVNAHTVRYGGISVSYNAVTNAVTGLTVGVTYIIYCIDSDYEGGTRTWSASTVIADVMNLGDGIVVAGQVTIPSSGSSSGGGGGGTACVVVDMVLPDGRKAGDIGKHDMIPCWDDNADEPGITHLMVESNELHPDQPCRSIVTESGATVTASESTPMTLRDGSIAYIPDMLGREALVRSGDGALRWESVIFVSNIEYRTVAKIKVHQRCYFAGTEADHTIATHNPINKP